MDCDAMRLHAPGAHAVVHDNPRPRRRRCARLAQPRRGMHGAPTSDSINEPTGRAQVQLQAVAEPPGHANVVRKQYHCSL